MTSQPRDKTRDSTKHDTAKFGIDLYWVAGFTKLNPDFWENTILRYDIIKTFGQKNFLEA